MLDIPASPIESPSLERMRQRVVAWEQSHDRRAIFLACYSMMTANMLESVSASRFEDPPWVQALLERFADYYFIALDDYEDGRPQAPRPWVYAFDAARAGQPSLHVAQHLILGVNAHINYDLVFSLDDMLLPEWAGLSPSQRQARYHDHCQVNDIIAATIDQVQDQVVEHYSPAMGWMDTLLGRLDEYLVVRLIAHWREDVWRQAVAKVEYGLARSPEVESLVRQVEQESSQRAEAILGRQGLGGLDDLL